MSERLKGRFCGCPYHDDDYEACIQYSGHAPCDPPDARLKAQWQAEALEYLSRSEGMRHFTCAKAVKQAVDEYRRQAEEAS